MLDDLPAGVAAEYARHDGTGVDTVGATILLADDEPDLRMIYGEVLRRAGYEVVEAGDGREALEVLHGLRPDLLLLDVWMPVVNGFEVLDKLRNDPLTTSMKVVMLSNLGDADTRLEGYSAGVADYWVKGLAIDDFLDRVRRTLEAGCGLPSSVEGVV
jgi:DNA-binding response OmpR family regulator